MKSWYAKQNEFQGLVIDEITGTNIAITYDKVDAALIAAAPDLYEALHDLESKVTAYFRDFTHLHPSIKEPLSNARAAISKATEN